MILNLCFTLAAITQRAIEHINQFVSSSVLILGALLLPEGLIRRSICLVRTDSGGSHYGSKYPIKFAAEILVVESRQFAAGIVLVAQYFLT